MYNLLVSDSYLIIADRATSSGNMWFRIQTRLLRKILIREDPNPIS